MKKNSKREGSVERKRRIQGRSMEPLTIGLDLGDQISHYCVLAENGEKVYEDKVATRKLGQPVVDSAGARGDRGQRAAGETDHGK